MTTARFHATSLARLPDGGRVAPASGEVVHSRPPGPVPAAHTGRQDRAYRSPHRTPSAALACSGECASRPRTQAPMVPVSSRLAVLTFTIMVLW
jgi:hypothetical protein